MNKGRDLALKVGVGAVAVFALFQTLGFEPEEDVPSAAPSPSFSLPQRETNLLLPDVVGLETGPSVAKIEGLGLVAQIKDIKPGGLWSEVLSQHPPPGSEVVPGTAVRLVTTRAERARLSLPDMENGCPRTEAHISPRFRVVLGDGPIRLGSQTEDGSISLRGNKVDERSYRISTLWTNGDGYMGPALVRGDRIDGPGSIRFEQDIDIEPFGPSLVGEPTEMHFARGGPPGGFSWGAAVTLTGGPGCYAFQIDGDGFTEHIVVAAKLNWSWAPSLID